MSETLHENNTDQHLLLIRGVEWDKGMSPEQLQELMDRFMEWIKSMEDEGILLGAQPLSIEGKVVSGANGRTVVDGPFAELKEAVGGYFLLKVNSLDRATEIAKRCPVLAHGAIIEVRPISEMCPLQQRRERERLAAAG